MTDPWKYLAFPVAAISGYLLSLSIESLALGQRLGLPTTPANILAVGLTGLIAGFLVDELIPAYLEKARGGGQGPGDLGGDMDSGDFDFDQ